jgi:phage shock protein A
MDWQLYAESYLDRARAERRRLEQLRHDAEVELTMLRRQAAQQYASMKAIGNAADQYKAEAERVAQTAEQAMLDDLTAARFVRRAREMRRSSR